MNDDIKFKGIVDLEDEMYYSFIDSENDNEESDVLTLPSVVEQYVEDAIQASNYNNMPAAMSFFVMLGQLVKDMIAIPSGDNVDDTRIQFLWLQTSGTGKSTLTNWYIPICRSAFEEINRKHLTNFDIFDITDYTDAALIGSFEKVQEQVEDDNGNMRNVTVSRPIPGQLEGSGLAMWDEFEYSGVFKQSQHKEQAIVYLNTFMNTLHGETWVISKKLKDGDEPIECRCRRSIYATTYIPKELTNLITTKGVLQRMLMFIYTVPQYQQRQMRRKLIADWGVIKDRGIPKDKYTKVFMKLYEALKERFDEVGGDPLKTVVITKEANDALLRECELMEEYITNSRPEVFEAMETFINRILKHIQKMAILCCVAEAPSISDKSKRFRVTHNNVLQASSLIRQCYKSLVAWLDEALREEKRTMIDNAGIGVMKSVYRKMDKKDGYVSKAEFIQFLQKETKKGTATLYRWYAKTEEYWEQTKIGRQVYIRLKEDNK